MSNIFPIDFEEKLSMAQDDYILFSDSEDGNKIKKAQYRNLKGEQWDPWTPWQDWADWTAATIAVGTTTTLSPWSSATVSNSWTSSAAVFNFGIPQWAKWEPWEDWDDWAAATITVWTTTTLPAWSSATVTNVWTSQDAILNFGIPKWDSWTWSWDVSWPASSTDGNLAVFDWTTWKLIKDWWAIPTGVPSWWTDWQVLSKVSWNIAWANAPVTSVNTQTWAVTLDADDISDSTTTNKFVTATDKSTWSGKQDALTLPATPTQWHLVTRWANNKTFADWWAVPTYTTITATLTSAWWSSSTQTVSVTGVTASNTVIVSPAPSSISDYTDNWVYCSAQGSGTLTFTCDSDPSSDITVNVVIMS